MNEKITEMNKKITDKQVLIIADPQIGLFKEEFSSILQSRIIDFLSNEYFSKVIATKFVKLEEAPIWRYSSYRDMSLSKAGDDLYIPDEITKYLDYVVLNYGYAPNSESFKEAFVRVFKGDMPEEAVIIGVDVEQSIIPTAIILSSMGIRPIFILEYCSSTECEGAYDCGIDYLRRLFGNVNVFSTYKNYLEEYKPL